MEKKTKRTKKQKPYEIMKNIVMENMAEPKVITYGEGENQFKVTIRPAISYDDKIEMEMMIADLCFTIDEKTGEEEYAPYLFEYAKRHMVVKYYTDFEFPENMEGRWAILKYTGLYEEVEAFVVGEIAESLNVAKEIIEHKKANLVASNTPINKFLKKISGSFGFSSEDFNPENMKKIMKFINSLGEVSADKIVDALVNKEDKEVETLN